MSFRLSRPLALLALATTVAGTGALHAQAGQMHVGPRLSYQFDLEEIGLGAQFSVPIARPLEFYPSIDIFLVDPGSATDLNLDLKYRIATRTADWLYVGTGINVARRGNGSGDSQTDVGVNAFIGAQVVRGRVHPFGEFRFTANNGSTGQLAAGLNFTI